MPLNFFDFKVRGIDISKYDLKLEVEKLVDKVHFVIVRIGHGTKTDSLFKEFWQALRGRVFRLTYFYLDYYSNHMPEMTEVFGKGDYEWGVIQGNNAWNNIKDDHDTKLVYLDIENGDQSYAPEIDTVWDRVETIMDGFFDTYDTLTNKVNGIYCSLSKLKQFSPRFRNRPLYIAWYNEDQSRESVTAAVRAQGWTGEIHFWQYASNGDTGTDGIGDGLDFGLGRKVMDLDVWMGTEDEWREFTNMADILLNITPLAQRDTRWKDYKLGTSNETIGNQGCLITCATMMCRYFGIDIDPAVMNVWLKANGGYQNTNWFVWDSLNKLDKRIAHNKRFEYAALDKIDEQLQAGKPVIINVDWNPATTVIDQHWVLVVGKVGGSYIINDPWYGTQFKFEDKYGAPSKGVRIVETYNFTGEVAPIPQPEPEVALYRVKVIIPNASTTDSLIIRSEPKAVKRTDTGKRAKYPQEYDVFEERDGYGRIGAGRWIALEYTQKLGELSDAEKLAILWDKYMEDMNG